MEGKFYIDHCHPFGLRPASSNSGQIANASVDIWRNVCPGLLPFKYEDDISVLRFHNPSGHLVEGSYCYTFDRDSCMALIESLQIPWHPTKTGLHFDFSMIFIGFFWDLITRQVSLPPVKRLKFLMRVIDLLEKIDRHEGLTLLDIQTIHGSLVHLCFVYVSGSSRLPTISNTMAHFKSNYFITRRVSASFRESLLWWKAQLEVSNFFRQLWPLKPLEDLRIYVDASTSWGIGIMIGDRWYAFKLVRDWKVPGIDIGWLEAVALELLMYFLVQLGHRDVHLLMHSDNTGAIGAHDKGRSRNMAINLCVHRTFLISSEYLIIPKFVYIQSALNPADPISRGILPPPSHRLTRLFRLPLELTALFTEPLC